MEEILPHLNLFFQRFSEHFWKKLFYRISVEIIILIISNV